MEDHEGSRGMRAGSWEGGRREKKEVGSRGRGAESLGEKPKRAGKETRIGGMERWAR